MDAGPGSSIHRCNKQQIQPVDFPDPKTAMGG